MSTEHHIIVESGTWPHPITHPMQIGFLWRKYLHCDAAYTPPPHLGSIERLQHNFEDRLRRAGAVFNPRQKEREPHTYHMSVPEERLGEVVTLLQGHPAASSVKLLHPLDGTAEELKSVLHFHPAPQAAQLPVVARLRLQGGEPVPCEEEDVPGPKDSCALLVADGREKRYGGQEYLAALAGRPLAPGEEAVLMLHRGSLLPWVEELKRRYEDDVEVYFTCRGSGSFLYAELPEHLHSKQHAIVCWERMPMETIPDVLPRLIRERKGFLVRMRFHGERMAMVKHRVAGCTEGRRLLSVYDLLINWYNGKHPWVARTYHDGPFFTYRIDPSGTAYGWSLKHQCPVKFQLEN